MSGNLIVLFDGDCNFCNSTVNFLIEHDLGGRLRYASLQSDAAAALLRERPDLTRLSDTDTVVAVDGNRIFVRSSAALRIAAALPLPWKLAAVFLVVPRFARDGVYRLIARNRHKLVRNVRTCNVPTEDIRRRFL